jgi:hypothetical protein
VARWAETARPSVPSWVNVDRQDNDYATLRRDVLAALAGDAKTLARVRGSDSLTDRRATPPRLTRPRRRTHRLGPRRPARDH